jgi:hypothetical protein
MSHGGVGTERGIKDPILVEVPLILHAVRVSIDDGGQRHVDEVAALALLILDHRSQRRRSGSLPTRHREAQDHQTQKRCSTQFEHMLFIIFLLSVRVLNRLVESIHRINVCFDLVGWCKRYELLKLPFNVASKLALEAPAEIRSALSEYSLSSCDSRVIDSAQRRPYIHPCAVARQRGY